MSDATTRKLIGRMGGHAVIAKYGAAVIAERARAGLPAKFLRQVQAAYPGIAPADAQQRADALLRAEMARIRLVGLQKARTAKEQ